MSKWTISWSISADDDYTSPLEAAQWALKYVQEYKTPVLDVTDEETGEMYQVDLELTGKHRVKKVN